MTGIFTRSKSEIFVHRTRSGHSHPDPKRRRHNNPIHPSPPRVNNVKDLRTHRVFSPATINIHLSPVKESQIQLLKVETGDRDADVATKDCDDESIARVEEGGVQVDEFQGTPPNADVILQETADEAVKVTGDEGVDVVVKDNSAGNVVHADILKNRVGIAPRPRSKVYRNPGSFSYRRLLPYLLDLQKDASGEEEVVQAKPTDAGVSRNGAAVQDVDEPAKVRGDEDAGAAMIAYGEGDDVGDLITERKGSEFEGTSEQIEIVTAGGNDERGYNCNRENPVKMIGPEEGRFEATPLDVKFLERGVGVLGRELAGESVKTAGDLGGVMKADAEGNNLVGSRVSCRLQNRSATCSRSKLYRNASSFGYRRLLPYLMGLEKERDTPGGEEIIQPHVVSQKDEQKTEVPTLISAYTSLAQGQLVGPDAKPFTISVNMETDDNRVPKSSECHDIDMLVVESTEGSPLQLHSEYMIEPNAKHVTENSTSSSVEGEDHMVVTESPTVCSESTCEAPVVTGDSPPDLEFMQLYDSSFDPTNHMALSVEELASDILDSQSFSKEEDRSNTPVLLLEAARDPLTVASQLQDSGSLGDHALVPKTGILKRHTRGCRGLCMCLDCASFRLQAEKGHEFSRRQILEADEVVTGLMKELSCLRNILDKSGGHQKQIKDICRRASRVEELAKIRMCEMIHEMNTHCRLPGPRVTFAERIEER